jgi:hypothetical protein
MPGHDLTLSLRQRGDRGQDLGLILFELDNFERWTG